jgi:hypothetical protein
MSQKKINTIIHTSSIQNALKIMDIQKLDTLIVINNLKKVIGIFTMGDFRRAVFFGLDIDSRIDLVINKNFKYLIDGFSKKDAKKIFIFNDLISTIPVLNKKLQLLRVINRSDFFSAGELNKKNINFNKASVVIMAGGKGSRLDPFTRILPKPLIPLGRDPIIKVIMDNFLKFGLKKFYISINEKKSMIKAYFQEFKSLYNIKYIEEKKPLGTAGSLKLLKNKLKSSFFVVNSDILILSHYPTILNFHKKNNFDITLISSMYNYTIPYAVCDFNTDGKLKNIKEKPNYNFFVNTGLYVIEPKVLELLPSNVKFDMDELLEKARKKGMNIGAYPITQNSWIDFGVWSEYKKNVKRFS